MNDRHTLCLKRLGILGAFGISFVRTEVALAQQPTGEPQDQASQVAPAAAPQPPAQEAPLAPSQPSPSNVDSAKAVVPTETITPAAADTVVSGSAGANTLPAEPTSEGTPLEVHGFVSQGFIKSNTNNYLGQSKRGSFEFAEVGINFTKGLNDKLRVGVQLFAHDLGRLGNYSPTFDWFYLDYHLEDWLGIRLGRTKLPFGLYNETNDIDSARVPILLPQSVYPVQNRDFLLAQTGGELYGYFRLGDVGGLEYRGYGGTLFLDTSNSTSSTGTVTELTVPYLVGGRLMWMTPIRGLHVGGSLQALRLDFSFVPTAAGLAALGPVPANFNGVVEGRLPALLWVGSVEYSHDDLLIATEFSRWHVKTESNLPALDSVATSDRFYVMASYRVTSWLTPGAYYSALFPKSGKWDMRSDYQHDVAATLRFDVNQNFLVKAEGHFMHGTAALSPSDNKNTPNALLDRDWGVLLLKATAYF